MSVRLLIVDDHEVVREGLSATLGADDRFEVVATASSGAEAQLRAGRACPDIALVDYRLPDISGDRLCREIRLRSKRTAVVILSSYLSEDAVRSAMEAGAAAYVSKAAGLAELRGVLAEVAADDGAAHEPVIIRQLHELVARRREDVHLTPQQERVLELAAEGMTYREVGARLFISESTVRFHMQKLKARFGARTKTDLIAKAIRSGLIAPAPEHIRSLR
jgi:DNA-binding NarL/FixJ family response regulator